MIIEKNYKAAIHQLLKGNQVEVSKEVLLKLIEHMDGANLIIILTNQYASVDFIADYEYTEEEIVQKRS